MTRGTHKLLWSVRGTGIFRRRILKEITQTRVSSEKYKEQQIEKLEHTLNYNEIKNSKLIDNYSYLDPSIFASKFNAFRFGKNFYFKHYIYYCTVWGNSQLSAMAKYQWCNGEYNYLFQKFRFVDLLCLSNLQASALFLLQFPI